MKDGAEQAIVLSRAAIDLLGRGEQPTSIGISASDPGTAQFRAVPAKLRNQEVRNNTVLTMADFGVALKESRPNLLNSIRRSLPHRQWQANVCFVALRKQNFG